MTKYYYGSGKGYYGGHGGGHWHCPPHGKPDPTCDTTFTGIYLGDVHSDQYIDRWEATPGPEYANKLNGTTFDIGQNGQNLEDHIVKITAHDADRNGYLHGDLNNLRGHEKFTTDKPVTVPGDPAHGTHDKDVDTFNFDAIAKYQSTITYTDGTTAKATLTVIQDNLGRTFVVPSLDKAENTPLEAKPIAAITLDKALPNWVANNMAACRPDLDLVVCFAAGTLLMTPTGPRAIEDIGVGDLVLTVDRGPQPVRWRGKRQLDAIDLRIAPHLLPIRIKAGALGPDLPQRDLVVSPQHRILVSSDVARELTGADEVLVAAKHLLGIDGVEVMEDAQEVEYHHILFDHHEVVYAEGLRSESLYTGKMALRALTKEAREEILTLFPELRDGYYPEGGARTFMLGKFARAMTQSHDAQVPMQ